MVKRLAVLVYSIIFCLQVLVYAGSLYKADIRQLYCYSDIMRIYMDASDKNGDVISKPALHNVAGVVDGSRLSTRKIERFGDTDEGIADIFLIDISGSIKNKQMEQVRDAICKWAENMKKNDRIAIITFGENVRCMVDYTDDYMAISDAAYKITNNDRSTQLYGGLSQALNLATRTDTDLPKRKDIILITDGINDYSGGVSASEIYKKLQDSLVPVYSMWMPNGEKGRATMNSVTEYSGGILYDMSNKNIDTVYDWIHQSIRDTYVIDFNYGDVVADGGKHKLSIKVAENGKVAEDSVQFVFDQSTECANVKKTTDNSTVTESSGENESEKNIFTLKRVLVGLGIAVGLAGIAISIIFIVKNSRRKNRLGSINGFSYASNESDSYIDQDLYDSSRSTININNDTSLVLALEAGDRMVKVTLERPVYMGRSEENDIEINDSLVSGKHCVFTSENGFAFVEDLGSTNGTAINGIEINSKSVIKNGDVITIGNSEFRISII